MQNWFHLFPKNTGVSPYLWLVFCIMPFYFIVRSSSTVEVIIGIILTLLFFASYRLSFLSKGWPLYFWVSTDMVISLTMTWLFGYIYFSLFLAMFIGHIQRKAGFITLYVILLVSTIASVIIGFFMETDMFLTQMPFIIICVIGVILLPFNMYNQIKQDKLEEQLEDANEQISKLMVMEERQRIARDLHDTLGQKLSLIGLKSDLAGKLVTVDPDTAKNELTDIRQTARTALKEVREMVSNMRGTNLKEEIVHVKQILDAAQIEVSIDGDLKLIQTPSFVENVLSMCLKEAVTNVVKHSKATVCHITICQSPDELLIRVQDDGIGMRYPISEAEGHGLSGMRERLEFVNGSLDFKIEQGTTLNIRVPNVIQQIE
ncbi:sensor histidine kinase [Aquibacillus koreensis]|nr:sensor histidine kinase [Aquibacillus koreensis]